MGRGRLGIPVLLGPALLRGVGRVDPALAQRRDQLLGPGAGGVLGPVAQVEHHHGPPLEAGVAVP